MIQLQNITLRRGAKVLLDGASVTLQPGEKVGLVGRNGAGKSTLFGLFNGTLHEDGGDFSMPAHWRLAQVEQNMPESSGSATDFVLSGDQRLSTLRDQLSKAEQAGDGMAIAQAHSDLHDAGAHDATARAQALILGLGFKVGELRSPVNSFSGGWRMRLQLARALMAPSDLLLLDEPTNHLDLDALVWLEGWLSRYDGTLIVISHDREFLDAVTRVTLHIEHARLTRYGGNYSAFEELRAQQLQLQQAAFARQQDKIAHLQKFIDRFKAKATKARQAQSRVKALERMEKIAPVLADAEFQFEFREPANLPNPMLAIRDATFGYRAADATKTEAAAADAESAGQVKDGAAPLPEYATSDALRAALMARGDWPPELQPGDRVILTDVTRSVLAGQRIGILGANGQGKSTFVKTVARTLPLLAGQLTEGKGLSIGYFAQQELDVLHPGSTPLEHMVRLARDTGQENTEAAREQQLRNFLGTFNFPGEMVLQPVGQFSGGEKARLVLAMIVWQRPNLLLLDEPTNHLDLATREALAVALNEFEGTVMLVSHDRALLRSVCDEFWLVARGGVAPFDGDLEDYQRYLLDQARQAREAHSTQLASNTIAFSADPDSASGANDAKPAAPALNPAEQRRLEAQRRQHLADRTKPLKRALQQAEQRMQALAAEQAELEARLATPMAPADIAEAGRRLKAVAGELAMLEDEWLSLTDQIEAIETAPASA
ncbi:ATP-binding cassette domain-containing protein [Ottowia sp.]|uniref:ABC-F family ATP-binding cassette domain-containing protein n=1 Tax=Ottowia sp. TaxID=1898956 RepID=UPI002B90E088|nr:ATP-binding cassette domain-containing protein [Ottowia sp.]HOB65870.1 ATP-binding cassette domain-containing protein [Ottowia sp.]HPZ58708.1 ATP-binding cassette domain-containing protein [Ottowia sp.]HQD47294.1 ATP-binding cassette domain-containing protein [Ottowia sp.]